MAYILVSLGVLALLAYGYLRHVYSCWKRHGFPHLQPSIPFGNLGAIAKRQASFGVCLYQLYQASREPFVGIYMMFKPVILVRDASLCKRILCTDFQSFHDRGVYCSPKHDPLSENLFAMTGHRWRSLRAKLTPSFTSGKLKNMMPAIELEAGRLHSYLADKATGSEVIDMKDLLARYSLNVIGSVIFGVDVDTIANPDHPFRLIEKRTITPELISVIKGACIFLCPKLLEFFKINSMPKDVHEFMMHIVQQQIEHREVSKILRKDFIQCLIELRTSDESMWEIETDADALEDFSIEQCAAQVFLMYVAGFDSTALTTSYTLFELARNPEVMRKLQAEIDEKLRRHGGQLTYECIQEMEFLELCLMESVRKYPALPILNRECTVDYPLPDSELVISKGTGIVISVLGLGRDPQYFPEPLRFWPERFTDDIAAFHPDAYIPFGDGPRACIAPRLGTLIAKMGIIRMVHSYGFEALNAAEIEFENFGVSLQARGGIRMRVSKRRH